MQESQTASGVSNQATFDQVVRFLRKQGRPSLLKNDRGFSIGAYRSDDGCRCSAGCLIPDHRYLPSMEGVSIDSEGSEVRDVIVELGFDPDFVMTLQEMHDELSLHWSDVNLLIGHRVIAEIWGLDPGVLDEVPCR